MDIAEFCLITLLPIQLRNYVFSDIQCHITVYCHERTLKLAGTVHAGVQATSI
jgi:hypothetical protein